MSSFVYVTMKRKIERLERELAEERAHKESAHFLMDIILDENTRLQKQIDATTAIAMSPMTRAVISSMDEISKLPADSEKNAYLHNHVTANELFHMTSKEKAELATELARKLNKSITY